MRRACLLCCWFLVPGLLLAAEPPPILAAPIPVSASPGAFASTLAVSPEGVAWLAWLEPGTDRQLRVQCATFDLAARRWNPPRTIASGAAIHASATDTPALAVGAGGAVTVLWYVSNPPRDGTTLSAHAASCHAVTSSSSDGGQTWSTPRTLSSESDRHEFASLAPLADGRVLAVWLDGRANAAGQSPAAPAQLFGRIVGSPVPDALIEGRVCDCCPTSLTAFPDGTALVAYRGRSEDEVRDIRVARFRAGRWEASRPLAADDWRTNACPVNGPQLASDGGRVAAAWFTAADRDPRVVASFSPDAGTRFLLPLRLSQTAPAGHVSTLLLHDGALLVSWVDTAGALVLRRVTPDFSAAETVRLAEPASGRIRGVPRLALLRDYRGGSEPALALAAYGREPGGIATLLVAVPEEALLEAANDCGCVPPPEQLRGYPLRGTLVAVDPAAGTVQVRLPEIPGLFAPGAREFLVNADALPPVAQPGREFLGRCERDGGGWRLFDLRFIASAPRQ